jgi:phosphoribosylformimino-5-aminoimidazole carboxamide ribonucleotide (ProFAR) isomerase
MSGPPRSARLLRALAGRAERERRRRPARVPRVRRPRRDRRALDRDAAAVPVAHARRVRAPRRVRPRPRGRRHRDRRPPHVEDVGLVLGTRVRARRSATAPASCATARRRCRWTRCWSRVRSTSAAGRRSCGRSPGSTASGSATSTASSPRSSSQRSRPARSATSTSRALRRQRAPHDRVHLQGVRARVRRRDAIDPRLGGAMPSTKGTLDRSDRDRRRLLRQPALRRARARARGRPSPSSRAIRTSSGARTRSSCPARARSACSCAASPSAASATRCARRSRAAGRTSASASACRCCSSAARRRDRGPRPRGTGRSAAAARGRATARRAGAQGAAHGLEPRPRRAPIRCSPASPTTPTSTSCTRTTRARDRALIALEADHGGDSARRSARTTCSRASSTPRRARPSACACSSFVEAREALPGDRSPRRQGVRLEAGPRATATVFHDDPVELVAELAPGGATGCTSSISTARSRGPPPARALVARSSRASPIPVEVGGGIRDRARRSSACSRSARVRRARHRRGALARAVEAACRAHPGRVIVAVDARDGVVAVDGWTASGGVTAGELGQRAATLGRRRAALHRHRARRHCATAPTSTRPPRSQRAVAATVIASGGIGSLDDLARCATPAIRAAVVGRALYDRRVHARRGARASRTARGSRADARAPDHPVPRRQGRPRRQGHQLRRLRDAGRSGRAGRAYDAEGADEICYLDISASPEGRSTLVDVVARTADQVFRARSRSAAACARSTTPRAARGRRRQDRDQHRRDPHDPELVAECAARFGSQAIVVAVDAKRARCDRDRRLGGLHATAAARPPGSTPSRGAAEVAELGAGRDLLTSMDRDGTREGYDLELTARRGRGPPSRPGDRLERRRLGRARGRARRRVARGVFHDGVSRGR